MLCTKIFYSNTVWLRDSKTVSMQRIAIAWIVLIRLYYRCQSTFFAFFFVCNREECLIFDIKFVVAKM